MCWKGGERLPQGGGGIPLLFTETKERATCRGKKWGKSGVFSDEKVDCAISRKNGMRKTWNEGGLKSPRTLDSTNCLKSAI